MQDMKLYQINLNRSISHYFVTLTDTFNKEGVVDEEVSEEVIESKYFVGYEFKENLLYVQQAIILYCLKDN